MFESVDVEYSSLKLKDKFVKAINIQINEINTSAKG